MKKILKLLSLLLIFLASFNLEAQQDHLDHNYFQLSPRLGFDIPTYNNNTPYIDYNGGVDLGLSVDYYWRWFGFGLDVDYIKNKPESTYPTMNIRNAGFTPFTDFNLIENGVTRVFYGIGPNVQIRSNSGKFKTEFNSRFGLASIKGGKTLLEGSTTGAAPYQFLNYHAGYEDSGVFTFKGQVRFTYFFSNTFGLNFGAYYMRHFGVKELSESGVSAGYHPFMDDQGDLFLEQGNPLLREEPCSCDISSIGLFAGLTFKFGKKKSKEEVVIEETNACNVCGLDHYPHCCTTCNCSITITAKDKFTGEALPNADILLTNINGSIVQTAKTNSYGVVVFKDVKENDYFIKGKLHTISLKEEKISKADFINCSKENSGIEKVILYTNEKFILTGSVVECNTPNGIQGVDVLLKDKINAGQKNTLSDSQGSFIFNLNQASTYLIRGKKDGYYSNEVEVATNRYNRNTTLFIDFEMCVDPCGKAIKLDNINFDLNKAEILPISISDLQRVVKLMRDNPNITVEMSSHTDSQGGDSYNQKLSQRRANATVNYIVNQGIARNRLIAKGAGESELKNTKCTNKVPCTDDEHRINRRTEFKVICAQ